MQVGSRLAEQGAPATQVAAHLTLGARVGDVKAVTWLRRAATEVASKAPGTAADLLREAQRLAGPRYPERNALAAELVRWLVFGGLDQQGRDELSRLLYGARSSLLIGVVSVSIGTLVGGLLGTLAGLRAGWVDTLIMRLTDVMLEIPGLLLAVGLAVLFGPSLLSVMVAIGSAGIPAIARMVRGSLILEREREHVVCGARHWREQLADRHLPPLALRSWTGTRRRDALARQRHLGRRRSCFPRYRCQRPVDTRVGRMLAESERVLVTSPQLVLFPGVAIAVTVLGCNVLGEALRDAMEEPDGGSV